MPELFFNRKRMTVARWPNERWAHIESIVESGPAPWRNHASDALEAFTFSGDHPARWANVDKLWLEGYWCFDWAAEAIRVHSVAPETRQITLAAQHIYGLGNGNPAPRRYRAIHLLEELDEPGEYYMDCSEQALYFWPPAAKTTARLFLSRTPIISPSVPCPQEGLCLLPGSIPEAVFPRFGGRTSIGSPIRITVETP